MKNQNKLNKIFIACIVILGLFVIQQKITERQRIDYIICYENHTEGSSGNNDQVVIDYCKEYIKE